VRRLLSLLSLAVALALAPRGARAEGPTAPPAPRHAIEVGVAELFEVTTTSPGSPAGALFTRRVGSAVALSITYRTPYFLSPFVDVGYYPLYQRTRVADLGTAGGRALADGTLEAVGFIGGFALDLSRVRLRAGGGAFDVMVRSSVLGATIRTAESDMGYFLALDGYVFKAPRFRVGIEVRAAFIVEAAVTSVGIGFTFSGDAIRF